MYDAENRLVSSTNGFASGTYTYDGNGLRVKRVASGGVIANTVYIFSGSKVIAEYDKGAVPASPTREYIYSGNQLLAKIESGATNYYHSDHLSARLLTDSVGTNIGEQGHYPFGDTWYSASSGKFIFTSYERDTESSNDYAMARYYHNRFGRFHSPDPLGMNAADLSDPQSLNLYAYVTNDPLNMIDPLGLDPPASPYGNRLFWVGTCLYFETQILTDTEHHDTSTWYLIGCYVARGDRVESTGGSDGGETKPKPQPTIINANGRICTPSVFDPGCKPPSCPAVFFNSAANALDLPAFPTGSGPEDAAKAAAAAAATKHIVERGLAVPLRSSIVRNLLAGGELVSTAIVAVPANYAEIVGLSAGLKAWRAGTCRTVWSK